MRSSLPLARLPFTEAIQTLVWRFVAAILPLSILPAVALAQTETGETEEIVAESAYATIQSAIEIMTATVS